MLAAGRVFVRDPNFPAILDAATGTLLGPFAESRPAPAVDTERIYDLQNGTLTATSVKSGATVWSFAIPSGIGSAPLEAGNTVFVGSWSGMLYGLSSSTGAVVWSTNVGSPIYGQTVMAAAGGELVVPATDSLVAYR